MTVTKYCTVKITSDGHKRLREMVDKVARDGWASVGADRNDKTTIANIFDEAIAALVARKALARK